MVIGRPWSYSLLAITSPPWDQCHDKSPIHTSRLTLTYAPLLQVPPLHLAIVVAKDPLIMIDCPPHERAAMSSAHSDLIAAIAKLRMTACMWQAFIAEDMRAEGLGRRSFRLGEE